MQKIAIYRLLWVVLLLLIFGVFVVQAMASEPEPVVITEHHKDAIQLVFSSGFWQHTLGEAGVSRIEMPLLHYDKVFLPHHKVLLGVPTAQVTLNVLETDSQWLPSAEISLTNASEPVIMIDSTINLRDQSAVELTFNPVQQTETGVKIYTRIVAELSWEPVQDEVGRPNHPSYEQMLANALFNYEYLERPPARTAAPARLMETQVLTPAVRIEVEERGLYALSYADLASIGFPISTTSPSNLLLHHRSTPIATSIIGGEDGRFDEEDTLLFFGESYEDEFTDKNIYWLTVGQGVEMVVSAESHPTATLATQFNITTHLEQDTFYWNTMPDDEGQNLWFWGQRLSPNVSQNHIVTFTLPTLAATPTTTVQAQLKGYTTQAHKSNLYLNNTLIDTQLWTGQQIFTHTKIVSGSLLVQGVNTLTVEAIDSGAVIDQFLLNWLKIDHSVTYAASNNQLFFTPPADGTYTFTLTDFTNDPQFLFDVTNPQQPIKLVAEVDDYSLNFQRTVTEGTQFLAATDAISPNIVLDLGSRWKDVRNSADWLIISHADFITAAHTLANHRTSQGLQTAVIDVQDIYDEFNDGVFSPVAIRDFLAYTHAHWQAPAPTYVVLLGDGSQDYKDRLGSGVTNFMPPKMIHTHDYGQTPSDHWYVSFAGDDVYEEMFVGRLSAETITHATAIVDNIITYETRPVQRNQHALFVADDEPVFETSSEQLIAYLPPSFDVSRIYAETYVTATMTHDITETMRGGATFINYAGHGNYARWGSYRANGKTIPILFESHNNILANSGINPFVTVADCLNGLFSLPPNLILDRYDETFAESLQRQPKGGAIAVWADAGYGYVSEQRVLMGAFYDTLFTDNITTLGPATKIAKDSLYAYSSYWEQNVRTMTLFGDPATQLRIDKPPATSAIVLSGLRTAHLAYDLLGMFAGFATILSLFSIIGFINRQSHRHFF